VLGGPMSWCASSRAKGQSFWKRNGRIFLQAIRFVRRVLLVGKSEVRDPRSEVDMGALLSAAEEAGDKPDFVVMHRLQDTVAMIAVCQARGIDCHCWGTKTCAGFPRRRRTCPLPRPVASG